MVNILVIGNPHSNPSTRAFLRKFVKVLSPISSNCYIISGDKPPRFSNVFWLKPWCKQTKVKILNALLYYISMIDILANALKVLKYVNVVIILPTPYCIHTLLFRFLKRKVIVFVAQKPRNPLDLLFSKFNIFLCSYVIMEAPSIFKFWNFPAFIRKKVLIGPLYVEKAFAKFRELRDRDFSIGYLGSLDERKGLDKLLHIFFYASRSLPNLKILIGGFGPYEKMLEHLSRKDSRIKFLGVLNDAELPFFYNSVRLFVLLSTSEGLPNVVLEAMASGTPVLATAVGGLPDLIEDGYNGFLVKPDYNIREVATKLAEILSNVDRLERVSERAISKILKEYSYESALRRYKKILMEISS
ncbi:MAG: glycosyltransferase family 4 protein [Candidatus Bathyarchaeia archaeon]